MLRFASQTLKNVFKVKILHPTSVFQPPPHPPSTLISVPRYPKVLLGLVINDWYLMLRDAHSKITNLNGDLPGIGSIHHAVGPSRLLRTVQRSGPDKHLRVHFNFNLMRGGSLLSELRRERVERLPSVNNEFQKSRINDNDSKKSF
jgi:hypothetical protein